MTDFNHFIENADIPDANDRGFAQRVFKNGLSVYEDRLHQYGFNGFKNVLDAGCGFGQWALAMIGMNEQVSCCDSNPVRVNFLEKYKNQNGIKNFDVAKSSIDKLPYADEQFDAVFCYGVIYLTPWKESLAELVRVLQPGGKLYLNANGLGWYKHMWYTGHNATEGYSPQKMAALTWLDTYNYKFEGKTPDDRIFNIIIDPEEMKEELARHCMHNVRIDGEGLLGNPDNKKVFFQKEYYGDIGIYEIIAEKK